MVVDQTLAEDVGNVATAVATDKDTAETPDAEVDTVDRTTYQMLT